MRNLTLKAFYVTVLGAGLASWSTSAAIYQEAGGQVVIEAEHFHERTRHLHAAGDDHHWHVVPSEDGNDFLNDAGDPPFTSAGGNAYVQVLPNGPGGGGANVDPKLDFKVNIQTTGTYQLFLRWGGASGSDDSLYAGVVPLADGTGGAIADWYRFSQGARTDFANSWQGLAGFERTDASGNNVPATWNISTPGIYTIRLSQREDGAAVDTVLLQLSSLPAPSEPGPAESAISTTFPVSVKSRSPIGAGVSPNAPIVVQLEDGGSTQVKQDAIKITLDGNVLAASVSQSGNVTTATASPPNLLPASSTHSVTLIFSDTASPAQTFTNTWQFVVANYLTLASSLAYPTGSADTSAPGFKARVVEANTFSGTLPNSEQRAEAQLAGTLIDPGTGQPYVNEANTAAAGADGFFVDSDVINWNQDAQGIGAEQGNFRAPSLPDEPIPGIPGLDGFNTDNIAAEILTFLELPAGAYTLGVNSDDGFVLAAGPDARDVLRTALGRFDGGRPSADTTFSLVSETTGIYSFRLIWYEGLGGANLEWFSVDSATGEKILINDRNNPKAIKAWRQITAPTRPFISAVSPTPNAASVPVESALEFTFTNGAIQVNTNSIQVKLEGQSVALTGITVSGTTVKVVADPPGNLTGTKTYTAQITYSDSAGNSVTSSFSFTTIRPPITLPPIRQDDAGLAVIEAEKFDANVPQGAHEWAFVKTPAGYSGEGTLYASPDAPGAVIEYPVSLTTSPRLDYKVEFVKTGTHYFWFRGSDGGGNSINAGIDGDNLSDTMNNIDQGCCGTRLVPGGTSYTWVGGIDATLEGRSQFEITQTGVHTINVWMREDGQIVDKLLITTDPNFIPSGAGPAESARVGDPFPPVISLTSPTADQQFAVGSTIMVTADASDRDGTVTKVEFFEGSNKIGEATSAPFTISFKPTVEKSYTLSAEVTDNSGLTGTSGTVKIVYGNPPRALFVGNNPLTQAGDLVVINHLESRNFLVTAVDDNVSDPTDADGKALVVISSTVGSGNVNVKFTDVAVPLINWEEALFDDLKMTGDSGADPDHHGSTGGLTQIDIVNPNHPLAAALSGVQTVTSSAQTMSWGYLDVNPTNAILIATVAGDPLKWAIWAYDKGGILFDGTPAPEKRIGIFFNGGSTTANTAAATRLFDAAVDWALGIVTKLPPTLSIVRKANGDVEITFANGVLESADDLTGSWSEVQGATSPRPVTPTAARKFYRVRQ